VNQGGAIQEVSGRVKCWKWCFAPIHTVPLVIALGLASIYRENVIVSLSFHSSTESFYTSTPIRLPQPAYAQIRQLRQCLTAGRQCCKPPAASTTPELAPTSPDHQPPRPRSPRRRRSTSGRRNPGARADVARPPTAVTPEPTSTSPDLRPPRPRVHLPAVQDQPSPTSPLRLSLAPASHRPPRRTRLDPDPAITRLSFLLSWASSSSPAIARPQHRARAPKTDITTEVNHLFHFLIPLCI
jgi:hypothetical protein